MPRSAAQQRPRHVVAPARFSIEDAIPSYRRSLAVTRTPVTVDTYTTHLEKLDAFLKSRGMPRDVATVRREHIESYLEYLRTEAVNRKGERGLRPATLSLAYRSIRPFWRWLVEEGEIKESPMARMKPPTVPLDHKRPISGDDVASLLATTRGNDFESTRDAAIMAILFDCGLRRGELAALTVDALDLRNNTLLVAAGTSKSKRARIVPFGHETARLIDRYLRRRNRHPNADLPALWLQSRRGHGWQYKRGQRPEPTVPAGGVTGNGLLQMIRRRATAAGLEKVYTHAFRHGFANAWLAAGGSEGDLMSLGGWQDASMIRQVYGARLAEERARTAHQQRFSPMDRLRTGSQ